MNHDKLKRYFDEQLKYSPEKVIFMLETELQKSEMYGCCVKELGNFLTGFSYAYNIGVIPKFSKFVRNYVPDGTIQFR